LKGEKKMKKNKFYLTLGLGVALILLVLTACQSRAISTPVPTDPPPTATSTPAPTAPQTEAKFVYGTYAVTIAKDEIPTTVSANLATMLPGYYKVTFTPEGSCILVKDGEVAASGGTCKTEGNVLVFSGNDTGKYSCQIWARYTWAIEGKNLTLTRRQDNCTGRFVVMTTHPWTMVEP
jgi:hypothetical protein